jgi:hypothetical protein
MAMLGKRHGRHGVAAPVLIAAVLLLAGGALWCAQAAPQPAGFWWRTGFPPASVNLAGVPAEAKLDRVDPADVLADLHCGSLDGARLEQDAGVFVWGWAYDPRTGDSAVAVLLLDHGRLIAPPIPVFKERPDVAAALSNRRLIASGWSTWLPAGRLAAGEHDLQAFAVFADHKLGPLGGEARVKEAGR